MTIEKRLFGHTSNEAEVYSYTLSDGGFSAEILTYGGAIRSLIVPVGDGLRDVALGFDDVESYEMHKAFFGALIGRVANRIGNAEYVLNGEKYTLPKNDGPNCLHGGFDGHDKQIWAAREDDDALVLSLRDAGIEGGFPGSLDTEVRYSLKNGALTIEYIAQCDADTPVNLTNHCYFNLLGHEAAGVEDHRIAIYSDSMLPVDGNLIPTGELADVAGTPFDFREAKLIGDGIDSEHPQIVLGGGYDHCFVLSQEPYHELSPAAVLECGGLRMTCLTTQPGIQLYSGNFLSGEKGKGGAIHGKRSALCLETQGWPDAVNHPGFPDSILRKGDVYRHTTVYVFAQV